MIVLVFSIFALGAWFMGILLFAIEIPMNGIGQSNLCDWQSKLSHFFETPENRIIPFLIVFHLSAFAFLFRLSKKDQLPSLPLEFGFLNFLFTLAGIILLFLACLAAAAIAWITAGSMSPPS